MAGSFKKPMFLDLRQIDGGHERVDRTCEALSFGSRLEGYELVESVKLGFDIYKDGERYRLVGRVRTMLNFSCCRCLEQFNRPVDLPFDLRYLPKSDNHGDGEIEIGGDDLTAAYYSEHQIDLRQLMWEQFCLAVPMKPLCKDACRGLCSICGMNFNRGLCNCINGWKDQRLAELKTLLNKDPGN